MSPSQVVKRLATFLALTLALNGLMHASSQAASFSSAADGDWTNGAVTWGDGVTNGGAGPQSGDTATIGGLHNIDVTSNEVFSGGGINVASGGSDPDIEITGGNTLTLDGGTFDVNLPSSDARINGGGTFINGSAATFDVSGVGNFLLGVGSVPTFRNEGTLEISNTGAFQLFSGAFEHKAGAVIQRTASGLGTLNVHPSGSAPTLTAEAGSIFNAVNAGSRILVDLDNSADDAVGTITGAIFQGDGQIEFDGYFSQISGTISGNATVELDGGAHFVPVGGTTYNVTGSTTGLGWETGHINTAAGQDATNNGIFSNTGTERQFLGAGEFINGVGATFRYDVGATTNMHIGQGGGATTFRNSGTFDFVDPSLNSNVLIHTGGATFVNESTGVVRRDAAGLGRFALHSGTPDSTFTNLGTVEVTAGEIEIDDNLLTTSVGSGGTELTEGTWNVLAGTGTATLDLQAGGTSAGSITSIGSSAKVVLGGTTPIFSQLSITSLDVAGTFGVQDQYVKTLSGNLTAPGTLEFGLEGADEGGTLSTGINVLGNVDFTGGTIDILDLGGFDVGTYRLINFAGTDTGLASLMLGDTPGGFLYDLITQSGPGGFVELDVNPVPEPSTMVIFALGVAGMIAPGRRRLRGRPARFPTNKSAG